MAKQRPENEKRPGSTSAPASGPAPHDSDAPLVPPRPTAEELAPPPAAGAGGVENIPDEVLPESEQVKEELNHAGLDIELPGQDEARAPSADEQTDAPPR